MTAPVVNPIVLFATYSAFRILSRWPSTALGPLLNYLTVLQGIFLGLFRQIRSKNISKAVHEHDFSGLRQKSKALQESWCKPLIILWYTPRYLVASLWPRPSLCPNTDPHFDQCDTSYCYCFSWSCAATLSLCSRRTPLLDPLLTSFGYWRCSCLSGDWAMWWPISFMIYLRSRNFYLAFIGCEWVVLLYAWFIGVVLPGDFLVLAGPGHRITPAIICAQSAHPWLLHYSYRGLYFSQFLVLFVLLFLCSWSSESSRWEDQSSLWLLGKSGSIFLLWHSFVLWGYFPTVTLDSQTFSAKDSLPVAVVQGNQQDRRG